MRINLCAFMPNRYQIQQRIELGRKSKEDLYNNLNKNENTIQNDEGIGLLHGEAVQGQDELNGYMQDTRGVL